MTQLSERREVLPEYAVWLKLLRATCWAVAHNPASRVRSMSVTQNLPGFVGVERRQLAFLAEHLAGEYGLVAEVRDRGQAISVSFSRQEPEQKAAGQESGAASR